MLLGIHGKAMAGKDTLAGFFCDYHGFLKYSFASPIKEACRVMFGWNDRHLYGDLKEVVDPRFGFSPRQAMQTLGTDWGRNILVDDIWIRCAQKFIDSNENVVIADVRFDNEAEFILKNNGKLIHIIRPSQEMIKLSGHASEAGLSENYLAVCHKVFNDGSLDKLQVEAKSIYDCPF